MGRLGGAIDEESTEYLAENEEQLLRRIIDEGIVAEKQIKVRLPNEVFEMVE